MLLEYLQGQDAVHAQWSSGVPGVQVCRFDLAGDPAEGLLSLPVAGRPLHFETLFCQNGCAIALLSPPCQRTANAQEILLLSDASAVQSFQISRDLRGILVAVDAKEARESLRSVCQSMGLTLDIGAVRRRMQAQQGCAVLAEHPWIQAVFGHLQHLPQPLCDQYAVFKAVELLYLLCTDELSFHEQPACYRKGYIDHSILQAHDYMQSHLAEKLTIAVLSRKFSLSPTTLKTGFRRMYGKTIHGWLMERRLEHARTLLLSSDLTIPQVAQAVGYSGVSQFHAACKRYYGMTPGELKKCLKP